MAEAIEDDATCTLSPRLDASSTRSDTAFRHVTHDGCDLSQACNASGITRDPKLGEHGGLIGLLSSGRLTREDYTVQALTTALFFAAKAARPWYAPTTPK